MIGTQVFSTATVGNVGTAWSVVGTADFNGDGKGDILWQDTSGNIAIWLMNGASILSTGGLGNVPRHMVGGRHRRLQRRRRRRHSLA